MEELKLSEEEISAYGDMCVGTERRELSLKGQVQTLLHSYSNALGPCPCGCRASGISMEKLIEKGLRGCYVTEFPGAPPRFLHPKEACLLLGIHPNVPLAGSLREALCLLGLVASPMQGVWILASLLENVDIANGKSLPCKPLDELRKYQAHLLDDDQWRTQTPPTTIELRMKEAENIVFSAPDFVIDDELIAAERINQQWGYGMTIERIQENNNLENQIGFQICHRPKLQRAPQPFGMVTIAIRRGPEFHVVAVKCGDFVFQALWQLGLPTNLRLSTDSEHVYPDERIWKPMIIDVHDEREHSSTHPPVSADGLKEDEEFVLFETHGLTDVQIQEEASYMLFQAGVDKDLFWTPRFILKIQETWQLLASTLIREKKGSNKEGYGIMCDNNHWVLFHCKWDGTRAQCDYWDGLRDEPSRLARACGCDEPTIRMRRHIGQTFGKHCGTIALLHLRHLLLHDDDIDEIDAILWFHDLCQVRKQELEVGMREVEITPTLPWTMTGTGNNDQLQHLAQLLHEKGVPESQAT